MSESRKGPRRNYKRVVETIRVVELETFCVNHHTIVGPLGTRLPGMKLGECKGTRTAVQKREFQLGFMLETSCGP